MCGWDGVKVHRGDALNEGMLISRSEMATMGSVVAQAAEAGGMYACSRTRTAETIGRFVGRELAGLRPTLRSVFATANDSHRGKSRVRPDAAYRKAKRARRGPWGLDEIV